MTIRIEQLYRYPIKSMGGETVESLSIGARGAVGDRVWAVRDEVRGGIRGAKKIPALMTLNAAFLGTVAEQGSSPARITAPDGEQRDTGATDLNEWLTAKLGHRVSLWPLLPESALEHYRRGAPDHEDFEAELREIFARTADEPLPDLALFSEVIDFESPPGTYFDAFPILVLSRQSLTSMARHRAGSSFHVSRFRPNLLLDVADSEHPFPEEDWVGRTLRAGTAELEVVGACPRCAMTTHGFGDLPRDPGIMRALVQANGGNLGVYARVSQPGRVSAGDPVEVLPGS
jgi:uncharacterized protein YcbX